MSASYPYVDERTVKTVTIHENGDWVFEFTNGDVDLFHGVRLKQDVDPDAVPLETYPLIRTRPVMSKLDATADEACEKEAYWMLDEARRQTFPVIDGRHYAHAEVTLKFGGKRSFSK